MRKTVELGPSAYRWILRHPFMSEDVVVGVVLEFPTSKREYINKDNFKIIFRRKKNKKSVNVTIWIQENPSTYFVYKMHSSRI